MARQKKLLSEHAPHLYAQIHLPLTEDWFPDVTVSALGCNDNVAVYWVCPDCEFTWANTVTSRYNKQSGCPYCTNRIIVPGLNCLKKAHPEIHAQLHPTLNEEAGIDITTLSPGSPKRVWWLCPEDNTHIWQTALKQRTTGAKSNCPHCWTHRSEHEFRTLLNEQAPEHIEFISSKIQAPRELFKRDLIQIDMLNTEHKIAIEYDGRFTHGGNTLYKTTAEECHARDLDTSKAILNAGYTLIRIREQPLPNITLNHPNLLQLSYKDKADKNPTLQTILTWLNGIGKPIT